ncbi:MAG: efflux transporter periplasmic adaptor subunit [Gammaproteobacteria bacterium RIFCSPHIGHO2_12_FULL_45_12]|nr:MAG: efflux transporter periplasmic adaptor subunit [Gammaproteobacteria bacterium RIFCSPHIGHO2_12_FULL_45_12]
MKKVIKQFQQLSKPMRIMLLVVGLLFGSIFIYKGISHLLMNLYFSSHGNPVVTVSTGKAVYSTWQPQQQVVGSLRTTLGVNVTAQLAGMIQTIYFKPGSYVKQGDRLIQQNADSNIAQLHALQANAELAKITYTRDKAQYRVHAVSKQQIDTDEQNLKSLNAQVAEQQAIVDKLAIQAPFSGRLGISKVNPGQYLNPGDNIVTLQNLDPIFMDFYMPQQTLPHLKTGDIITFTTDAFPGKTFSGKITTIDPMVDISTRNVEIEATIPNHKQILVPGMFVNVNVTTAKPRSLITVPQSAVTYNPYGDIVYVVKGVPEEEGQPSTLTAHQIFVTVGLTRGDQASILSGIKEGDIIVTSGQLKLKNGSRIAINNTVQPSDNPDPAVTNQHQG